ncbi:Na-translocating system protein MpsC family protein [Bacillus sp. UNC438CL73TsuS30]|uniref:Na-translocating system protein MpsC family protein n=1 Tax=Bacillus sp. UNC438CL73TsuS30 TaxID=1340434 RepID=UPI00047DDD3F|nr:Na-translocating system protein MpsC family protein [Bacillus sp. UNC438CL73TsuS30]
MENKQIQMELASYIGRTLRENFGKGPESVFVSYNQSILTVYLRNFLTPSENVLLTQDQEAIVQKTRDMLMQTLIPEFKAYIKILTGMEIKEFYYDWGLHNKSGVFIGINTSSTEPGENIIDLFVGKEQLHEEIIRISIQAQREPEEVESFLLNQRTLVIIRKGILVSIERELIRLGSSETLRLAKRNLEKRLLHNSNHFETILKTKVNDIFVDWDFNLDKSAIVLILSPTA